MTKLKNLRKALDPPANPTIETRVDAIQPDHLGVAIEPLLAQEASQPMREPEAIHGPEAASSLRKLQPVAEKGPLRSRLNQPRAAFPRERLPANLLANDPHSKAPDRLQQVPDQLQKVQDRAIRKVAALRDAVPRGEVKRGESHRDVAPAAGRAENLEQAVASENPVVNVSHAGNNKSSCSSKRQHPTFRKSLRHF
jgi:hypothetical protein